MSKRGLLLSGLLLVAATILASSFYRFFPEEAPLRIGLHQQVGPINPLSPGNRPSLAAQQLTLPALVEFLGRARDGVLTVNQYRLSLIDTLPGAIRWDAQLPQGTFTRFRLRQDQWYDPRSKTYYQITARDVKATIERIKQLDRAQGIAHQQGRMPTAPFLNFVAQAIEAVEIDPRNPKVVYIRFANHILGPNRLHALTFRVLPEAVLDDLGYARDVPVTATPYVWTNWDETGANGIGPGLKPPDTVLHFAARAGAPGRPVAAIDLVTKQDLRSYKLQLESGAYGLAFGLPHRPGEDLTLPEHMEWQAYASSDLWALVFNCRRVPLQERRALLAALSQPGSTARLTELFRQNYASPHSQVRKSVFPNYLLERHPRVLSAIENQAATLHLYPQETRQRLAGRQYTFVYSYGMGDQFEPDIIADTVNEILAGFSVDLHDQPLEFRDLIETLRSGANFDIALFKYSAAAQLPEDFDLAQILPMIESRGSATDGYSVQPGPDNYFHFADPALYEAMIDLRHYPSQNAQGRIDTDQLQRRQAALVTIDRIARQEAIGVFLFSPTYHWFWDKRFNIAFDENKIIGGAQLPKYSAAQLKTGWNYKLKTFLNGI